MKKIFLLLFISLLIVSSVNALSVSQHKSVKKIINLHVVKKTSHSVTIQWKKRPAVKKYQIRVLTKNLKLVKKVLTTKHKITIKKLKPNITYKFRVRGKRDKRFGKYSKIIKAKTEPETLTPEEQESDAIEDDNDEDQESDAIEDDNDENQDSAPGTSDEERDTVAIPYGFWGLNGYHDEEGYNYVQDNFNANVYQVYSSGPNYNINNLLPVVESSNMKISLNITGNYTDFDDAEGNFDITLWEEALDDYFSNPDIAVAMQEYIDNDTIVGIMLLDDIYNFTGADPTAEEIEQMACGMEEYINVTTWVREDINENLVLEDESFQFDCLNAFGLQYSAKRGSIESYINQQQQAADDLNLDIIAGLNIADGGDGSSGQQGWRGTGFYAMSANEITTYGEAMLNEMNNVIMFLMWEYDGQEVWPDDTIGSDYFNQPEFQEAIYNLGELAEQY